MAAIKVKDLTKKYGRFTALDKISFEIAEGDFFGFIGPNGAGKTTTIKSILNLLNYSGKIEILGKSNRTNYIQENIGYVPGEANLYENLTPREHIQYFANYYKNVDEEYLHYLIELLQLDLDKKISSFSLGNKKKVSVILALMHKPKVLIFDEVSNGLDPLMQKALFEELSKLNEAGTTIFFSSHNLEDVQNYCKNVAIIREGKIVAIDNIDEILKATGVKIRLITKNPLDTKWLKENCHNLKLNDETNAEFIYKKDMNKLLADLSKLEVTYFRATDVKLEEIFEDYYKRGEEK